MLEKTLRIEKAAAGESMGITTIESYAEFTKELTNKGVKDIFGDNITIKQDGNKYIFFMNNEAMFNVKNGFLETWVQKFYDEKITNEKIDTEKGILIRMTELEGNLTLEYISDELNLLKEDIKKTQTKIERATNIENIQFKIGRLIEFFEQEKKLTQQEKAGWIFNTKYDRRDRGLRNIQKTEIDRRLKQLHKIKKQIERVAQNKDKKYSINRNMDPNTKEENVEVKMDDTNGYDMKQTLIQFNQRIEELSKEVPDFIIARNDIVLENGDTTPYYEYIINNKKDARKLGKTLKRINQETYKIDKLGLSVAKRQALQQDLKALEKYLEEYINNSNEPLVPFVPTSGEAFAQFCAIDPELKSFAKLNKKAGRPSNGTPNPSYPGTETSTNTDEETTENNSTAADEQKNKTQKEWKNSEYTDIKEAFAKGGINGVSRYLIDQTNMKSEQKQFWSGVGNLAITGGVIFIGWKMISSAFKLLGKKGRTGGELSKNLGRLFGPAALIFGAQARSGEGPMKLFTGGNITEKSAAGIFGRGNKNSTEVNDKNKTKQDEVTKIKYAEGFPGATALFNGLTYQEMGQFLIEEKGQIKINPLQYETMINNFKNGPKKNPDIVKFLESIGKDDEKHVIDLALTGMGITMDDIQKKPTENFNKSASEAIVRLRSVVDYMEENGYNKINQETQYLVDRYIANKDATIDDLKKLDKRGDVFYKETTIVDKTGLKPNIEKIANGDKQKEEDLLLALNTFYEYFPRADKKIEITGTRPKITFTTYGQPAIIDLDKKELIGFTPKGFDSYYELFKAANLTNRIKDICKDKVTKSEKPFYLSTLVQGKEITFDNATIFSTDFDTEIMKAKSLKDVSPILDIYKQEYCDYLNTLKFRKTKA